MGRLHHLAGGGVDIVFVFDSVGNKFQLKNRGAVVVVKFPVVKHRVRAVHVCLGQGDFLGLFQGDVGGGLAVLRISRVVIAAADGHHAGGQLFHRRLGAGAHILQKTFCGQNRAWFQLKDNAFPVPVQVLHKITGLIDLCNQILQHLIALFSNIILVRRHNPVAVRIQAVQPGDKAFLVVLNLDFRVHAEGEGPCLLQGAALACGGGKTAGQKGCRQDSQGRSRCKLISSRFHIG